MHGQLSLYKRKHKKNINFLFLSQNGFFINRSLEEYEMDSLMIQLEYLLKHRKIQSQIANIWRKTRSKEKYQQERFLQFRSLAPLYAPLFSAEVFLH